MALLKCIKVQGHRLSFFQDRFWKGRNKLQLSFYTKNKLNCSHWHLLVRGPLEEKIKPRINNSGTQKCVIAHAREKEAVKVL